MKKRGSVSEFKKQRAEELLKAFKSQLHLLGVVESKQLFARAAKCKASRFWVSEHRAGVVVSQIYKGSRLERMNPKRREMYFEIYRRVKELRDANEGMTLNEAVFRVVNSPAPEFYLTSKSARAMIYKIRC